MEESKIIEQCIRGHREGQRLLFDSYYNYVYTVSFRYLRNHHDAEDVVSEVFNRVFKNIQKFKRQEGSGLKQWIQTISINESLRFLKKKAPIDYTDDILNLNDEPAETTSTSNVNQISDIKKVIEQMPEGYRRIFLLNVVDGLSHTEIASHLGISRNTSKSQMLKARKYLQSKLEKDESKQLR